MDRIFLLAAFLTLPALAAGPFDRIYVFGDSYSDTGAGYVDGNGPTAVAYMAERMGLQLLAANDSRATPQASVNFAVSGARTGRGEGRKAGEALLGLGMVNQVEDFIGRLAQKRIAFEPDRTLFFIAGGLNDSKLESSETVHNLESIIRTLYAAGGRHFALATLPEQIPAFRAVGVRLNPVLRAIPGELPEVEIRLSHWGEYFDEVMEHPSRYGIANTKDACAGRAIFQEDATPCAAPDGHYYYHAGHPSTAVHKIVGEKLFEEIKKGRRE